MPALIGGQDAFVVKLDSTGTYSYAKVLGGSGADRGYAIAVDSAGNAYITGDNSAALTNVAGTTTGLPAALGSWDAYVVKLDNTGAYSYAKVLGGSGTDAGYGIAVDASNVYLAGTVGENLTNVAGQTLSLTTGGSSGFWARLSTAGTYAAAALALDNQSTSEASSVAAGPNGTSYITGTFKGNMMCGATQLTSIGTQDAFVAKVGADGRCAWAKQIGGAGADLGRGIAVDVSGNAYVTGYSLGALTNVAGTTTGLPAALGSWDAYVVKLDSAGAYSYAKLIGGAGNDQGYEIAVDASNNVYITGFQGGLTNVAGQTTGLPAFIGASADAFVVKLDSAGAYSYAKALGGAGNDYGFGIAVDSSNNAYVTGYNTAALTNVAGQTAGLPALIGGQDAFVVKLDSSGTYSYSKLIAGSGTDTGRGIAVDVVGNAYITGYNTTALTNVADQTTGLPALIGGQDAFVVKLDNAGAYSYSKLIGGTSADTGVGIAVDVSGNAYITGSIQGWSKVADQTTGLPANFGQSDAYVVKLDSAGAYSYSKLLGGYYQDYGYGIALLPNGSVLAAGQANRGLNLTFASKTWNVYSDSFFLSRLQPDGSFAY